MGKENWGHNIFLVGFYVMVIEHTPSNFMPQAEPVLPKLKYGKLVCYRCTAVKFQNNL